jgi:predicted DNA-binding helix-hairpin-helix protein
VGASQPNLDLDVDPKLGWALRHLDQFPVDINTADIELIKRIPGIGFLSAQKIVAARRFRRLQPEHLKKMGIAYNRSQYFLAFSRPFAQHQDYTPLQLKELILSLQHSKYKANFSAQLRLF